MSHFFIFIDGRFYKKLNFHFSLVFYIFLIDFFIVLVARQIFFTLYDVKH
ncbi:formyltetrahydrofolate deformylase [Haemophilus influenzae]|nr:formyltetrahydrofolate deformylase [Haemophilus influenzae]RFN98600.1 formyltetrahydrofolate deformylase [Haemophilus influenzae]